MAETKPPRCPKSGAAPGVVTCPACGAVFWADLASWTVGWAAAAAACLVVLVSAASPGGKVGAAGGLLACAGGLAGIRNSLLRAARIRTPDGDAGPPLQVRVWTAAASLVLFATTTAGFVWYDRPGSPPASSPAGPASAALPAATGTNPLPVGVTFRPSGDGTGQAVFLTGAPGAGPRTVRVTTPPPKAPGNAAVPVGRGRLVNAAGAAAALWQVTEEAKKEQHLAWLFSADVAVRPGVETAVAWNGGRAVTLPSGTAVTLTCPGFDPLTTSVSVPPRPLAAAGGLRPAPPPVTPAEALTALEEAGRQVRQARTTAATTLLLDGKFDDAIREFGAVLADDPKAVYALNGRGYAHGRKGDVSRAFDDLDASVRVRPEWAPTYRLRGQVLFHNKAYRAAAGEYTHAIRLDPRAEVGLLWFVRDPFSAHLERAVARIEVGEFAGAVGDCDAELRLNPDSYEAYGARALAHQHLGNDAAATADRGRAIELGRARPPR